MTERTKPKYETPADEPRAYAPVVDAASPASTTDTIEARSEKLERRSHTRQRIFTFFCACVVIYYIGGDLLAYVAMFASVFLDWISR